ncbi:receptor-type tyrosine-protein phosphatase beta [Gadus morhua]|uniref:receptor-type tyrosine-protein phosphatase beta n=1 Tax=Gadus morhua TaxID=8049 RepID=UPI0011B4868B|nr:receptor-type tyrosine-protein phosphatase beta-like [Gadus morhua]
MDKVSILFIIAPLLSPSWSERQFFPQSRNASWAEARRHCQVCYKDLVTMSYDNSFALVEGAKSPQWIGLRETFNETDAPWSAWANGDPITFQNWYPVKPPPPVVEPCTTIAAPTVDTRKTTLTTKGLPETSRTASGDTLKTALTNTALSETSSSGFTGTASGDTQKKALTNTALPETSSSGFTGTASGETSSFTQTYYSDMTFLTTPQYVREDCVAMHHFGPWVEEDCNTELPYICYDDRYYGIASVVRDATTATVSWETPTPSENISSYRVEVQGGGSLNISVDSSPYRISNMTPGTKYEVRVFAVKCDRELNSQNISFITKPETPYNLTVENNTESSAALRWERPVGNLEHYCVRVENKEGRIRNVKDPCNYTEEEAVVKDLTPGNKYTVYVLSVTGDVESEKASITVLTRPSVVTDLNVSDITNSSLVLRWVHEGSAQGYNVVAMDIQTENVPPYRVLYNQTVNPPEKQAAVDTLPPGTNVRLMVQTLYESLKGAEAYIDSFIVPDPARKLVLDARETTIEASWDAPDGSYNYFIVSVWLHNSMVNATHYNTTDLLLTLPMLYAAAQYEVTVTTHAGDLKSDPTVGSTYTQPVMAQDLKITFQGSNGTLTWTAPQTAPTTRFRVKYVGRFWNHHETFNRTGGKTSVGPLRPGTQYLFQVITVSGTMESEPANCTEYTPGNVSEVTLSMMCSSKGQDCEENDVKEEVLNKLREEFGVVLDGVSWKLDWKTSPLDKTAQ